MSEPMTPERLAEIRKHVARKREPGADLTLGDFHARDLLDEVERLQQKAAKDHDELRDKRTDLLNIRGILSPQPSAGDRVVPMPLGAEVAPAIEWLAAELERLRAAVSAAEDGWERDVKRLRAELEEARTQQGRIGEVREAAVREAKREREAHDETAADLKQAEAERDRLAEQVKRATDPRLIRFAIADPGAFTKREKSSDGDYETVPAWGARAVVLAVQNGGEQRG